MNEQMSETFKGVKGRRPEILEGGTYPATVADFRLVPTAWGERVAWIFQPDGYSENARPAGFTSKADGYKAKPMEWARRILGKSDATDMKWGKDLKEKRPVVNWGPEELLGKPCRIVVEKNYDEDFEEYSNIVVNVLPPDETNLEKAVEETEEDFENIPF